MFSIQNVGKFSKSMDIGLNPYLEPFEQMQEESDLLKEPGKGRLDLTRVN